MSFYSKISLFALLAAGSINGQEPPVLKYPAQSAASRALNQLMIKVFSETQLIDIIQRNYLEASETFKNMLQDVGSEYTLVLPESTIADYVVIKDLLTYEYRFNANLTDEKTIIAILKPKTEQQLIAIVNACQRCDLKKIGECAIIALAEKLNTPERKEECLKNGSYNLNWTPDVARLVAQAMIHADLSTQTFVKIYWLAQETIRQKGQITAVELDKRGNQPIFHSQTNLFFTQFISDWDKPQPQMPLICYPPEKQKKIISQIKSRFGSEHFNHHIAPHLNYLFTEGEEWSCLFKYHAKQLEKYLETKIIPEELVLLESYFHYKQFSEYSWISAQQFKKNIYNPNLYAGINTLKQTISPEIRNLLFPNWWQRRSWLSKAAIITGAAAATGLAAWYGYKHFSKK